MALTYSLFGHFVHAAGYTKKYPLYDDFDDEIQIKPYIKFPVYIGLTLGLCFMCLIKNMDKLNFSEYIGVIAVVYSLLVVLVQCHSYYKDLKKKYCVKEDKDTHINWIDLGKTFTKDLEF